MPETRLDRVRFWASRSVATLGVIVVLWAALATSGMLVHGHPAYVILLVVTLAGCLAGAIRSWFVTAARGHRRFAVVRLVLVGAGALVIAATGWLVPSSAQQPALDALRSDSSVSVTESSTSIVLTPTGLMSHTGVFFQPGAKVDARAYAAILRPLVEAGHRVVIPKQPLGIGFLATGAFAASRSAYPSVTAWVVGGHSLGGTVAAIDAQNFASATTEPVVGLLLYGSYPASSLRGVPVTVLSISGSNDGLSTPAAITASKASLPVDARFLTIAGGIHSYFGDYGEQSGDGTPTISHAAARAQISAASVDFVDRLDTK